MNRVPFLFCLGVILYGCDGALPHSGIDHLTGKLEDWSIGTLELGSQVELVDFGYVNYTNNQSVLTAYSPVDSLIYRIGVAESSLMLDTICKLENYHRMFSQWFDTCSVITVENETGRFTLREVGIPSRTWRFDNFAPQIIPNRKMKILDNQVYILNSSYYHDTSTLEGAQAYYREVRPILIFNVEDPQNSVHSAGWFPIMYGNSNENISDYQPFFCVDNEGRCILSYGYSDSLIIVENGQTKSVRCKSAYYKEPSFLSFDDAESMTNQRKFYAENSRYLGVFFNSIRSEYYRIVKNQNNEEGETRFSIIIMNEEFFPLSEWVFETSSFMPYPIIYTQKGFMLANSSVTSDRKRLYFEHFGF